MTPEQIDLIRTARGLGVPWVKIARHLECSVDDCRRAIGMPVAPRTVAMAKTKRRKSPGKLF